MNGWWTAVLAIIGMIWAAGLSAIVLVMAIILFRERR
jgi:hypothetical protein